MYVCDECDAVFFTPATTNELLGEWYHSYDVCPNCESELISDAVECRLCGSYMAERSYEIERKNLCEECETKLKERFRTLIQEEFDEEEIKILCEIYSESALDD